MYAYPSVLTWRSREWQREIGIDAEEEKERNERERSDGERGRKRGEVWVSRATVHRARLSVRATEGERKVRSTNR